MTIPPFPHVQAAFLLRLALLEDLGFSGHTMTTYRGSLSRLLYRDVTTRSLFAPCDRLRAHIEARANGILAGGPLLPVIFKMLGPVRVKLLKPDGRSVRRLEKIALLEGSAAAILAGERTVLNFLSRLSGIATVARLYADAVRGARARVLDTRKTTPGWRDLEKYAVRAGGATNHRRDLAEHVLVKDNHIAGCGLPLSEIVRRARRRGRRPIEIEVTTLDELRDVLPAKPDIILLDNMTLPAIRRAVKIVRAAPPPRPAIEVSGGVTLATVRAIARTGVDRISAGALTHSAPAIDFSLEVVR
ncbi:MAG: carboxylating nicotinate-nucleotide diphosphorylase [Planctomycetota bacterium]